MLRSQELPTDVQRFTEGDESELVLTAFEVGNAQLRKRNRHVEMFRSESTLANFDGITANSDGTGIIPPLEVTYSQIVQCRTNTGMTNAMPLKLSPQNFRKYFDGLVVLTVQQMLGPHLVDGAQMPFGVGELGRIDVDGSRGCCEARSASAVGAAAAAIGVGVGVVITTATGMRTERRRWSNSSATRSSSNCIVSLLLLPPRPGGSYALALSLEQCQFATYRRHQSVALVETEQIVATVAVVVVVAIIIVFMWGDKVIIVAYRRLRHMLLLLCY
mmetsp:Transcript_11681/g.24057  ORF Transcript_11681/g.24057 Transcript_11681/m.24057 type:complete len:274 (+) Transcript_11681:782-1603(+)